MIAFWQGQISELEVLLFFLLRDAPNLNFRFFSTLLLGYFKEILRRVSDADRILIFGPGEAKIELKKEIENSIRLAARIKKIESADKMSERQIAAKARSFFKPYM